MVVLSYSSIKYISRGHGDLFFYYWCAVYGICNWSDTLWHVGRIRLFATYTFSLSSLCKFFLTTKMRVSCMLPSVCLRLRHSLNYILYNIWSFVLSTCPILLWWSWECVLYLIIIIKSEAWSVNHRLGLGHETMVRAVCLTMFLSNV